MDKKKQIEEMAAIMANCDTTCDECFEQLGAMLTLPIENRADHCQAYMYAQRAFDAGYRKIPKGMIVIDENEYKDKIYRLHRATQINDMLQENVDVFKAEIDKCADIVQKVKKDILELVLEECRYLQAEYSHYCKTKAECIKETSRYEGVLAVRNAIYKLAQKCRVEVE